MVIGSLRPLISFLNVSYCVSFVAKGQRPRRGLCPKVPPHKRAGGGLDLAGGEGAMAPAGRALEPAGSALEPAGGPRASWEGQLKG